MTSDRIKLQQERDQQVRDVLVTTGHPIGPTQIARAINKPWCMQEGRWPRSSAVVPVLRRIGAIRHPGGLYTAPGEDITDLIKDRVKFEVDLNIPKDEIWIRETDGRVARFKLVNPPLSNPYIDLHEDLEILFRHLHSDAIAFNNAYNRLKLLLDELTEMKKQLSTIPGNWYVTNFNDRTPNVTVGAMGTRATEGKKEIRAADQRTIASITDEQAEDVARVMCKFERLLRRI